jgi:hypothetical protein
MIIKTKEWDIDISKWYLDDVFWITVEWDNVEFMEHCDYYIKVEMTKEEAIKTLEYFIEYIKTK